MTKKLTKSQNDQVFTGTLAGIAEYFGIDPTTARVIYVFASFFLIGSPILLYILMAIFIPSASSSSYHTYEPAYNTGSSQPKQAEAADDDSWGDF